MTRVKARDTYPAQSRSPWSSCSSMLQTVCVCVCWSACTWVCLVCLLFLLMCVSVCACIHLVPAPCHLSSSSSSHSFALIALSVMSLTCHIAVVYALLPGASVGRPGAFDDWYTLLMEFCTGFDCEIDVRPACVHLLWAREWLQLPSNFSCTSVSVSVWVCVLAAPQLPLFDHCQRIYGYRFQMLIA